MAEKIKVSEYEDLYLDYTRIDQVIEILQDVAKKYGRDSIFRIRPDYEDSVKLSIEYKRLETDSEFKERMRRERTVVEYEKQQLANLLKKYGSPSAE